MRNIELTPGDVQTASDGRFYVACKCGERIHLDKWSIAHLYETEITTSCPCGRRVSIDGRPPEDDE